MRKNNYLEVDGIAENGHTYSMYVKSLNTPNYE